jgi:DNA polymerase III epsilon subunit-like protein
VQTLGSEAIWRDYFERHAGRTCGGASIFLPGGHDTLDDLCLHYGVDRSHRTQHGALLDVELLAAVYVEQRAPSGAAA